ncbi:MAG: tRNA (adenosine(37)-N6)-threonylcarbamoyltransferase complex transferase subunit TsaD [Chitinivibrionales bacterium]|nr:tRNA (adenosine(37)-N6)-threonylcarbamoyltransferase complex transferase subunit TsaD [Chitinivibrionales bacterium]MBD3356965.1 tRNA (adenosine(37)-N6)-threonylcarbamoyltransferase complex transferase subunit TsaD [Chitinivibrionales bacterium]
MKILGIETSCDETSVAILDDNRIAANRIYTQEIHSEYGGVVPEIASRAHIQKVDRLCAAVLNEAAVTVEELDLIAVTDSPGLAGALLVGMGFAMGLSRGFGISVTGVNHLEGHIASVTLEDPVPAFPFIALVVSGGHTALYVVEDFGRCRSLGMTIDDAAGEAFDKVGKLLGFRYPAGRSIEEEARRCPPDLEPIPFPVAKIRGEGYNFSFSGLKTAVKYHLSRKPDNYTTSNRPLICRSFQQAVVQSLMTNAIAASRDTGINRIALVGGVACNGAIRHALRRHFGDTVFFPSPKLCTDNAAMIAKAGLERRLRDHIRPPRLDPSGAL